jgi:hypothetical protein
MKLLIICNILVWEVCRQKYLNVYMTSFGMNYLGFS